MMLIDHLCAMLNMRQKTAKRCETHQPEHDILQSEEETRRARLQAEEEERCAKLQAEEDEKWGQLKLYIQHLTKPEHKNDVPIK